MCFLALVASSDIHVAVRTPARECESGRAGRETQAEKGEEGGDVWLPVDVIVGADGENSRVRDLANITVKYPLS